MKAAHIVLLCILLVASSPGLAKDVEVGPLPLRRAILPSEAWHDIPVRVPEAERGRATTWYGQYTIIDGEYYALAFAGKDNGCWTFDRGTGPANPPAPYIHDGEGWSVRDLTLDEATYFRLIDNTLDLGPGVPPPIISAAYTVWVGVDRPQADELCWDCGAGYGNRWCQRLVSEPLAYNGTGNVTLAFLYWSQAEPCFDGTQVYLKRQDGTELLLNPYPPGTCPDNPDYEGGTFTDSIGHYSDPVQYMRVILPSEIQGAQDIRIIFEFTSDIRVSDEDCFYDTIWGPFGVDDIQITGGGIEKWYSFEIGTLDGWTPEVCAPVGDFVGIANINGYMIPDPCCSLVDNILEMHEGVANAGTHPDKQHVMAYSPICLLGGASPKTIAMEFNIFAQLPINDGVFFRPGWLYYPWTCDVTGVIGWSDRVGQDSYEYLDGVSECITLHRPGTDVVFGVPVPTTSEMVVAIIEIISDCEAFGIPNCTGATNFSPIFDSLTVVTCDDAPIAPPIDHVTGSVFQDVGSFPSNLFDPMAPGPANVTFDLYGDTVPGTKPDRCGDSLVVVGPIPGIGVSERWQARLWWRVARRAPLQADNENGLPSRYTIWKERVSDGREIDRPIDPEFTSGCMDSVEIGGIYPLTYKFKSDFCEMDDDFRGEGDPETEMIWDDVLYPGSRIEYYITANYVSTPNELYYLPDISGGHYLEFEVLPGLRTAYDEDCGGTGFHFCVFQPATLYIDGFDLGNQHYIEQALYSILNGTTLDPNDEGREIPEDRNWDRYDYADASSNWNAPFVRGAVVWSNNGVTLSQILGYRTILLNTGTHGAGAMQDEDFQLFDQWLVVPYCDANIERQVFIMNGDNTGELLTTPGGTGPPIWGPVFLTTLGATLFCDGFNGVTGPPCGAVNTSDCVQWLPIGGGPFATTIDVSAYGNWCPELYTFNVFSLFAGGRGNRFYNAVVPPKTMSFAQVCNEDLTPVGNYRTVLDGVSWDHMTEESPPGTCPRTFTPITTAIEAELSAALRWGFDAATNTQIPTLTEAEELSNCQGTWPPPNGIEDRPSGAINRLYRSEPNPTRATAKIRFSMATEGHVKIELFDVHGRLVRTLVDEHRDAGVHTIAWDGKNNRGRQVVAGVYWSQMKAGSFVSKKNLVVLR
jgi:hypothetical protein